MIYGDGLALKTVGSMFSFRANDIHKTERHGRVVSTPASYSGGPGFKSRPGDRLA
jgi:hypothetical protein